MDIPAEVVRSILQNGEDWVTVFRAGCPSEAELDALLSSLSLVGGGRFLVGIDAGGRPGVLVGNLTEAAVEALSTSVARLGLHPQPAVNAVKLEEAWVAYCAFDTNTAVNPAFEGLTLDQARLLLALIRADRTGDYRSSAVALRKFGGWFILFSGKNGKADHQIRGDFEEADICALRDEGYLTLINKTKQFDLSLKPKASRSYEKALNRGAAVPAFQTPIITAKRSNSTDVFICHAGPDKAAIVSPLIDALDSAGVTSWFDANEIFWGDSLTGKISEGLRTSRYVVVLLSPSFLGRAWPERELNATLGSEAHSGRNRVLPLLAGTTEEIRTVLERYPLLADKKYLTWGGSADPVVKAIKDLLDLSKNERD